MPGPRFKFLFLSPNYWAYWVLLLLIGIATLLPRRVSGVVGAGIGNLFRIGNTKRARSASTNLQLCFPHYDEEMREKLLIKHFHAYGRGIIDLGLVWWASEKRLRHLIDIKGLESWLEVVKAGERTILVTPHTTCMDLGGIYLSKFFPIVSMMNRTHNLMLTWILWSGRGRFGARILMRDDGIRQFIRSLEQGSAVYMMPDEDLAQGRTVFAPFFGVETSTLSVVGRLSKITEAKIFPTFIRRLNTGRYEIEIQSYLREFPTGDDIRDAKRINEVFENGIGVKPEQYLWTIKWFNNRPGGGKSPYV